MEGVFSLLIKVWVCIYLEVNFFPDSIKFELIQLDNNKYIKSCGRMNRYQKIIKYTKPLVEIDEKIRHLNERMTTTGMYTVTNQDDGIEEVNPTFEPAPLGDFADLDNFSWADQGDGSSATANISQLKTTDVDGIVQRIFDMPNLDYPSGTAYAMAFGPNQAVTGNNLGYISDEGFVSVYQINNVFQVPRSEFQDAFVKAYEDGNFVQKTITMWSPLLYRVTTPIQPAEFYPAGRTFDTTPQAEKGLYGYTLLIPTDSGNVKRNDVKTDDGVRARGPIVNSVLSRNDLGDPNYYAGNPNEFLMGLLDVGKTALDYLLGASDDFLGMDALTGDVLTGLEGAGKTFVNFLVNNLPPVIGNKFLGQDYVDNSFSNLEIGYNNGELISVVKDNVIGSGQYPTYDSKTNSIEVKFKFDFKKNVEEFKGKEGLYGGLVGEIQKGIYNALGPYSVDAQVGPAFVGPITGSIFGTLINIAKGLGGGKPTPGKITISPQRLKELNPKVYDQLIRTGDLPSDAINIPSNPDLGLDAPELSKDDVEKSLRKMLPPKVKAAMDFQQTMTMDNFNKLSKSDQNKVMDGITKHRAKKYDGSNFIDPGKNLKNLLKARSKEIGKTKFKDGFMVDKDPMTGKERKTPLFSTTPGVSSMLALSHVPSGNLLTEGWESPKHTNIEKDMRKRFFDPKDIAPEYPKEPPAPMVGGYSSKSKLAPKKVNDKELVIKITKKDLLRNHRLTKDEVQDMMNTINKINAFLAANPGELIHAQIRYPKDDPRLAELNWKMDQQLAASDKYIEKQFPENQRLFDKITQATKKTIALTDPKTFKDAKPVLTYGKVFGNDLKSKKVKESNLRKKSASRFFKKEKKVDTSRTRWIKG